MSSFLAVVDELTYRSLIAVGADYSPFNCVTA